MYISVVVLSQTSIQLIHCTCSKSTACTVWICTGIDVSIPTSTKRSIARTFRYIFVEKILLNHCRRNWLLIFGKNSTFARTFCQPAVANVQILCFICTPPLHINMLNLLNKNIGPICFLKIIKSLLRLMYIVRILFD